MCSTTATGVKTGMTRDFSFISCRKIPGCIAHRILCMVCLPMVDPIRINHSCRSMYHARILRVTTRLKRPGRPYPSRNNGGKLWNQWFFYARILRPAISWGVTLGGWLTSHGTCIYPKDPGMSDWKGINPTILLWVWDWDHQTYSNREGYGFLGLKPGQHPTLQRQDDGTLCCHCTRIFGEVRQLWSHTFSAKIVGWQTTWDI